MAVKTFTTGEVLTAADTNTYLANSGLVYISSGSFSNAATFDVTGFTTTYQTFHAVLRVSRHSGTGASNLAAVFRDATTAFNTNYYGATWYVDYLSGSGATGARNSGADFYLSQVYDNGRFTNIGIRVAGMNQTADRPNVVWQTYNHGQTRMETGGYEHATNNNTDRFRVSCAVNVTGNWRLYGYREP